MRYRINTYTVNVSDNTLSLTFSVNSGLNGEKLKEAIRLIVDETDNVVLCSSMQKGNVADASISGTTATITFNKSKYPGKTFTANFKATIEVDFGENLNELQSAIKGDGTDTLKSIAQSISELPAAATSTAGGLATESKSGEIERLAKEIDDTKIGDMSQVTTTGTTGVEAQLSALSTFKQVDDLSKEVGVNTDSDSKATLFGKILSLRNYITNTFGSVPYDIGSKGSGSSLHDKVGTSADTSSNSTIFGKLAAIISKIGASTDASTATTVHGKLNSLAAENAEFRAKTGGGEWTAQEMVSSAESRALNVYSAITNNTTGLPGVISKVDGVSGKLAENRHCVFAADNMSVTFYNIAHTLLMSYTIKVKDGAGVATLVSANDQYVKYTGHYNVDTGTVVAANYPSITITLPDGYGGFDSIVDSNGNAVDKYKDGNSIWAKIDNLESQLGNVESILTSM